MISRRKNRLIQKKIKGALKKMDVAKNKPFYFYTQYYLIQLLGIKARNPEELLKGIKKVPESSIYYHTQISTAAPIPVS